MADNGDQNAPETGQQGTDAGATKQDGQQPNGTTDGFDAAAWSAFAKDVNLTPEQIRERLGHARTWEQRAKDNKGAADRLPTLEQQVEQMRQALADRDARDVERAGRLAMTQVHAGLADAGIKTDDVKELLDEIEPTRLLKDGDPDDQAIARIVGALRKAAGRPTPDRDQGKTGGPAPTDMSSLIRRAAGITAH